MRSPLGRVVPALLVAVAAYYGVWGGEYSAPDLWRLHHRREDAVARLAESRRQVDSLRHVADLLDHDPATIERVARERFGMIRDGELLYRFVTVEHRPAAVAERGHATAP